METVSNAGFDLPPIRKIDSEQPWLWLVAGWRDIRAAKAISLSYGLVFALLSYTLTGVLIYFDLLYLLLPMAAGVMFIGPMLAVGLYEISRRLESGLPVTLRSVAFVSTRSPTQIALIGFILALFMLAWIRIATLLFALFFGLDVPPVDELVHRLLFTRRGLVFLGVGSATGGVLSFLAFAISAISIPRLMVRDTDVVTAIATSIAAVSRNLRPMLLWAWLITLLTLAGVVTFYLGLIVVFPLIGHATWHAYRGLVDERI